MKTGASTTQTPLHIVFCNGSLMLKALELSSPAPFTPMNRDIFGKKYDPGVWALFPCHCESGTARELTKELISAPQTFLLYRGKKCIAHFKLRTAAPVWNGPGIEITGVRIK